MSAKVIILCSIHKKLEKTSFFILRVINKNQLNQTYVTSEAIYTTEKAMFTSFVVVDRVFYVICR